MTEKPETPIAVMKARLYEADAIMDTLKKANENGDSHLESIAVVTSRLINQALDEIEKIDK